MTRTFAVAYAPLQRHKRVCRGLCRNPLDMSRWLPRFVVCVSNFHRKVLLKVSVMEFRLKEITQNLNRITRGAGVNVMLLVTSQITDNLLTKRRHYYCDIMHTYTHQRRADPGISAPHRQVASTSAKLSCLASASALSATVVVFKIYQYQNPGPAFNNMVCAKNCKCNWNFVVLLLLESRNVAVRNFFFSCSVHVRIRKDKKLLRSRPHLQNACGCAFRLQTSDTTLSRHTRTSEYITSTVR